MTDSITFGGLPVVLDAKSVLAHSMESLWPGSRWPFRDRRWSEGFSHSTLRGSCDKWLESPYPLDPLPGINELIIPTGAARYAKALLLFEHPELLELAVSVWGWEGDAEQFSKPIDFEDMELTGTWGSEQNYLDLEVSYNDKTLTWSMTALSPQLLSESLWLVPVVDRRFFLNRKLRSIEFTDGTDMSWSTLFSQLATLSGMAINQPGSIDSAYLVPDRETFEQQGVGVGHAIDAAALSVGLRVVPSSNGTELTLVTASGSRDLIASNYTDITDGEDESEYVLKDRQLGGYYPRLQPKEVALVAPILRNYYQCNNSDVFSVEIDEADGSKESVVVFTTCYAQYLEDSIVSDSSTKLSNLSSKLKTDLADWTKWSHGGAFAAIADYELTGHDDYWRIGLRHGDVVCSQVRSLPHDFFPRVQCSQSPAFFRHLDDSVYVRMTEDITAADDSTFAWGYGDATPYLPNTTGTAQARTKSDGSSITIRVYNGAYQAITYDAEGSPQFLQCKRINCMPLVDVEYCPLDA